MGIRQQAHSVALRFRLFLACRQHLLMCLFWFVFLFSLSLFERGSFVLADNLRLA